MYITYERTQWRIKDASGYLEGPIHMEETPYELCTNNKDDENNNKTKEYKFEPTLLVRVSDMQVVPGSTAVDQGYCALSYAWNQSGEMVDSKKKKNRLLFRRNRNEDDEKNDDNSTNKEITREDKGLHKIISSKTDTKKTERNLIFSIHKNNRNLNENKSNKVDHVQFEKLVQQIAQDFGVQYIWYDQMCIDQHQDPMEIARQLQREKHQVFEHANYTIALVPELEKIDPNEQHQNDEATDIRHSLLPKQPYANMEVLATTMWSKRMWIMEEAYMSQQILFVGRNVFLLSNAIDYKNLSPTPQGQLLYGFLSCKKETPWNAATLLWYTKTRTSTHSHDRIFALMNMFPHILGGMQMDYNRPIFDLTIEFYERLLTTQDLSILLFGIPVNYQVRKALATTTTTTTTETSDDAYERTILTQPWDHELPSWAGTTGIHLPHATSDDCQRLIGDNSYNYKNYSSSRNNKKIDRDSVRPPSPLKSQVSFGITCSYFKAHIYNPESIVDDTKSSKDPHPECLFSPVKIGCTKTKHKITSNGNRSHLRFVRIRRNKKRIGNNNNVDNNNSNTDSSLPIRNVDSNVYKQQQNENATYLKLCGLKESHVLPVKRKTKNGQYKGKDGSLSFVNTLGGGPTHTSSWLSLVEDTFSECFILSGIKYHINRQYHVVMPVVAKVSSKNNTNSSNVRYKAVGVCIMEARTEIDPKLEQPKQEFVII
ncbi:hypothetical protein BDA99DRAFT_492117 [Phascolomyces articulosus]|uniref:Heterokaryon incompatibility domain-containing protein n=1 Tax=Phascolomyces articulosus TaxID=60185 RepID=A0AAD5PJ83_9FUNG|nr:hypothetical protein BDA99DRAFT_492117 [Phascolomyces articulosus]